MTYRKRPFRRRNRLRRTFPTRRRARAIRELKHAHRLMEDGDFEQANEIFTHLGEGARRRGLPQAPFIMLQASKAQLSLDDGDQAYSTARRALSWLEEDKRWALLYKLGSRVKDTLDKAGYHEKAEEIQIFVNRATKPLEEIHSLAASTINRVSLPEKCPYCGGTINPEFCEILGDGAAICTYCGSRIKPT